MPAGIRAQTSPAEGAHLPTASVPPSGQRCAICLSQRAHSARRSSPDLDMGAACCAVPFTPSQGVKTPSPDAHTARCHLQGGRSFTGPPNTRAQLTAPQQAWAPALPEARSLA